MHGTVRYCTGVSYHRFCRTPNQHYSVMIFRSLDSFVPRAAPKIRKKKFLRIIRDSRGRARTPMPFSSSWLGLLQPLGACVAVIMHGIAVRCIREGHTWTDCRGQRVVLTITRQVVYALITFVSLFLLLLTNLEFYMYVFLIYVCLQKHCLRLICLSSIMHSYPIISLTWT